MNSKTRGQIFISVFVTLIVAFGAGYFTGNSSFSFGRLDAQAGERADMTSFWKVWDSLNNRFVSASSTQNVSDEEKMYGAIQGLVDSMGDPYTVFMTPKEKTEFEESITGLFEGVGMEVGIRDGLLTIISPLKNSPAERAGILKGDKILKIDGKDSTKMATEEAITLIRGKKGTVVTLEIGREGKTTPIEIKITRDTIVVPTLETKQREDVFIISLYSFGTTATAEFRDALREFVNSGKTKLVLDLRGNPGGYLDAAVDISSWFLPAGKSIVSEDFGKGGDQKVFRSKGYNAFKNLKMVVLIDKGSASASEIVAGALQEHGVARLVGEQSFGKGSVQELIPVTSNTALKVTIARWLTPNGNSISDGGLKPDVEVEFDAELYKNKEVDTQLEKALELLR